MPQNYQTNAGKKNMQTKARNTVN